MLNVTLNGKVTPSPGEDQPKSSRGKNMKKDKRKIEKRNDKGKVKS
jgi:hypothetical protein